ncbi:MAG: adenylate/guanylate cyclase domain-containing protein [Bacteroidota bacterium]
MEPITDNDAMDLKDQLLKIFWITVAWVLISILQYLIGLNIVLDLGLQDQTNIGFWEGIRGSIFSGLLAGVLGGATLVFLSERWLRTKPYGWALRSTLLSYTLVWLIVSIPSSMFFDSARLELSFFHPRIFQEALLNLTNPHVVIPYLIWLIIVVMTMIALLVNDKYGPGVFLKFLMGKYFNPSREERVFMFLDLRSSTTIAEQLGEERYFHFLRDVYREVTPAILKYKGEIYQYVGDEIIVTWTLKSGIGNANCLNCFYDIRALLARKRDYFETTFGVMPEFKAGMHYGPVMAGEIGVVKRDIAFSGDVLNTTSRIQDKCNEFGVNLLLSKSLMEKIAAISSRFEPREIGEIELRGKREKVALFTV